MNNFSKSWSSYRSNWNRTDCNYDKNDKDEVALSQHYSVFHGVVNKPPIHEAYIVVFVEQPTFHYLNKCEDNGTTNLM